MLHIAEFLVEIAQEFLAGGGSWQAGLRADQAVGRFLGEREHLVGTGAVTEYEDRLDAQLTRLFQQRAAGLVHAAVEYHIRILGLDLGENRLEIGFGIGGALTAENGNLVCLQGLLNFIGQPFAVGGLVVDQGNFLRLDLIGDIGGNRRALLVVTTYGAEGIGKTTLGQHRIGGRAGDHRDAGLAVNLGSGDRHAGIQVANYRDHFGVHQLGGHRGADFRVALVIFGNHHELDQLAADLDLLVVGLRKGQCHAIFVVLAQVRRFHRQRSSVGNGHGNGRLGAGDRFRLFLATTDNTGGQHGSEGKFVCCGSL